MSAANICNTSFTKFSFCEPSTLYSRVWEYLTNKTDKPSLVHDETIQRCSRNLQLLKDLHVPKTKSSLPGHFNGFRPSVIAKTPISYLTEVSHLGRPNKAAEAFSSGDFAGFYEIWTQTINTEAFLPGDFAGFIDIWAQEEELVRASPTTNTNSPIFEDSSDIWEDTDISIPYMAGDFAGFFDGCFAKQTKTYWPADFFNYEKMKTKHRSYLPGCFYFCGQIVKNDVCGAPVFLPGDFEGFFDIWTTETYSIDASPEVTAFVPSDFPCFFQTWVSSPKTRPVYFPSDFYFWKNATTEEQPEIFFPKDFYFWQAALAEPSPAFMPCDFTGFLGVWLSSGYKATPPKKEVPKEVPKKAAPRKAAPRKAAPRKAAPSKAAPRKAASKKSTAKIHTVRPLNGLRGTPEPFTFQLILCGEESTDDDLSIFDAPRFGESDPSDAELEAYLDKVD